MTTAQQVSCTYDELQRYVESVAQPEDAPNQPLAILWCDSVASPQGDTPPLPHDEPVPLGGLVKDIMDWLLQPDLRRR